MYARLLSLIIIATLALSFVSGCQTAGTQAPPESEFDPDAPYVIGIPDLLRISVWKHPDLSIEAPVRRDGKISVPLLDDVQAAGSTPEQLSAAIAEQMSASVSRPKVTVIVLSADSQVVTVIGGVNTAGTVSLHRNMGVLEAVAAAGGFSAWANKGSVRVLRVVDGQRVPYRFDYSAYMAGKPDSDIPLLPGDVIVVPE